MSSKFPDVLINVMLQNDIDPYNNIHFSELGEDLVVRYYLYKIFGDISDGFYIDVGAHHPRKGSTTAQLYDRGWHGINIDASAEAIEAFKAARPGDISLQTAVAKYTSVRNYYMFDVPAVNTLDEKTKDEWVAKGWKIERVLEIQAAPLQEIISPYIGDNTVVDYLNIDIEGLDMEALETYNFAKYPPKIISVEIHNLNLYDISTNETVMFLSSHGYTLVSYLAITAIFIKFPNA